MRKIMTKEQRDALFKTISDLSEMNRMLNNQAKKIENREGEYWKRFTNEEISKKVEQYDLVIKNNGAEIALCLKELSDEYGWEL